MPNTETFIVDAGCFVSQSDSLIAMDPVVMSSYVHSLSENVSLPSSCGSRCCFIPCTKPGLWTVYAIAENFPSVDVVDVDDEEERCISQLVLLNRVDMGSSDYVSPEIINSLNWKSYDRIPLKKYVPAIEAENITSPESYVEVESGQVGFFCVESIHSSLSRLPPPPPPSSSSVSPQRHTTHMSSASSPSNTQGEESTTRENGGGHRNEDKNNNHKQKEVGGGEDNNNNTSTAEAQEEEQEATSNYFNVNYCSANSSPSLPSATTTTTSSLSLDILLQNWYHRSCELSCMGSQVGIVDVPGAPVGAVCSSGLGDHGTYYLEVLKEEGEGEEVSGCRMVFMKSQ